MKNKQNNLRTQNKTKNKYKTNTKGKQSASLSEGDQDLNRQLPSDLAWNISSQRETCNKPC